MPLPCGWSTLELRDGVGEFEDENLELKLEIHELRRPSFLALETLFFNPFLSSVLCLPINEGREDEWGCDG